MYKISFYKDASGSRPVLEYMQSLLEQKGKDSRIKYGKLRDYIKVLQARGKGAGLPYIKRIDGDIWELRPLRDRIFFVAWENDEFILLHQFMKQTQKTPQREINIAKHRHEEIKEGGASHE